MYTKKLVFPLLRDFESCLKQAWVSLKKKVAFDYFEKYSFRARKPKS